jgi:hypothetical protein
MLPVVFFLCKFMTWTGLIVNFVSRYWGVYCGELNLFTKPGVNRPLSPKDDGEKNINKTVTAIKLIKLLLL